MKKELEFIEKKKKQCVTDSTLDERKRYENEENENVARAKTRIQTILGLRLESSKGRYPPIVLVHQLYLPDDKGINKLWREGEVILISVPGIEPSQGLVDHVNLVDWIHKQCNPSGRVENYLEKVLPSLRCSQVEKAVLKDDFKLNEPTIMELVNFGLLIRLKDKVYGLSVPGISSFSRAFRRGRKTLLGALKRNADNEVLIPELENKTSITDNIPLGLAFQIKDLIGAELAESLETTEGTLLRLKSDFL